jgi:hypothetical protein
VAEAPLAQERRHLPGRLGGKQQAGVAGVDHRMVGHARQPGLVHRHRAVMVVGEAREQRSQPVGNAAGDRADAGAAFPRAEAFAQQGRTAAEQAGRGHPSRHAGGRAAAGERRAEADYAPHRQVGVLAQCLQRDQSAQAVRDDVGFAFGAQQVREARRRLVRTVGDAVVAEDARIEALRAQLRRQPVHRGAGHPQPVQQHDAPAAGRRGHAVPGAVAASRRYMNSMSRCRPTGNSYSATLAKPCRA